MIQADFDYLAQLLYQRSGLVLSKEKAYLLESRLLPVARKWKFTALDELARQLRNKRDEALVLDVVEAMTTNESFFFRDQKPFDQFKQFVLPKLVTGRAQQKTIRIWSAACSTGQEPYSLAMILAEAEAMLRGWKIDIVATDLSNEVLAKAKQGCYSQFEVQRGLPVTALVKFFRQGPEGWTLDAKLRSMVHFRPFNLLHDPAPLGRFDVVFCRNVLIYFDQSTKARVLANIAKLMPEDGVLFLGGAETVLGLGDVFKPIADQRGLYAPSVSGTPMRAVGTGR